MTPRFTGKQIVDSRFVDFELNSDGWRFHAIGGQLSDLQHVSRGERGVPVVFSPLETFGMLTRPISITPGAHLRIQAKWMIIAAPHALGVSSGRVTVTARRSPLRCHVSHVVVVRAFEQMTTARQQDSVDYVPTFIVIPNAGRVVAGMANQVRAEQDFSGDLLPCCAVCVDPVRRTTDTSVPVLVAVSAALPTVARMINTSPENSAGGRTIGNAGILKAHRTLHRSGVTSPAVPPARGHFAALNYTPSLRVGAA